MKRMIKLTPEQRDTLMARYDVSHVAIWEACNYITRGERPDSIRRDALALGGRYIEEGFIPQCSFHRTPDGGFIQKFGANVVIIFDAESNLMRLIKDGTVLTQYNNVSIAGWTALCEQAQLLAQKAMTYLS